MFHLLLFIELCTPLCMNGGTCVQDVNNDYMCDCASGFTGNGCEIPRMIFFFIYELCAANKISNYTHHTCTCTLPTVYDSFNY